MIDELRTLIDDYIAWLRDKTVLRDLGQGYVEITTPCLDPHNDYVQIYAKARDGGYLLTDGGETIQNLEQTGCSLESPKRQNLLRTTVNGFGVRLTDRQLETYASHGDFPVRKHNLLQAILAVHDIFYLASPMVASLFHEDVEMWLDLHEVRYTPQVKFTGKSGYDHLFDFVIPKSGRQPERILQAINQPSRQTAERVAFAWFDTREARPPRSKAYALLNNTERPVPPGVLDALRSYEVTPVPWTARESVRDELAA